MNVSAGTLPGAYGTTARDVTFIIDVALIAALWCVSSLIVDPIGNFPLNDDWSYGLAVKHFLESGDFRPLGWTSMTLFTNVLWGSLFCLPAGFSFTALRLSTLVAGLLGLIGTYVLVRDLQQPRSIALIATLTMGFNPIYFALSHTFMTDVPFTALAVWSAVFFGRCLKSDSTFQLLIGTLLAVAATLSRQFGLCIPLVFAATFVLKNGLAPNTVLRALTPPVVCVGTFVAFTHWLSTTDRLPVMYGFQATAMLEGLSDTLHTIMRVFSQAAVTMTYSGLFLLPVLLTTMRHKFRLPGARAVTLTIGGALAIAAGLIVLGRSGYSTLLPMSLPGDKFEPFTTLIPIPIPGNILINSGIGPLTLRDTHILHLDHVSALPAVFWGIVTACGLVASVLLVGVLSVHVSALVPTLSRRRPSTDANAVGLFLLLFAGMYMMLLIAFGLPYDRYLIPSLPFLAAGLTAVSARSSSSSVCIPKALSVTAVVLLVAFGTYAVSGTRDYLEWQRLRWRAAHELIDREGVDAAEIDGGFEFNGLHFYDPHPSTVFDNSRSWWWVRRDTYQIGFGPLPDYKISKEYEFNAWLPPHIQKVVVLQKRSESIESASAVRGY